MYSGVGRLDSPKYSFRTPSILMAISASSRMRECGTRNAEGATAGVMCFRSQDSVEQSHTYLWALGGEIIRDLQETPKLRKTPVHPLVDTVLENDGPLLYRCDSEQQQNSLESTCRKLRHFRTGQLSRP